MAKSKGDGKGRDVLFRVGVEAHPQTKSALEGLCKQVTTTQRQFAEGMERVAASVKTASDAIGQSFARTASSAQTGFASSISAMGKSTLQQMDAMRKSLEDARNAHTAAIAAMGKSTMQQMDAIRKNLAAPLPPPPLSPRTLSSVVRTYSPSIREGFADAQEKDRRSRMGDESTERNVNLQQAAAEHFLQRGRRQKEVDKSHDEMLERDREWDRRNTQKKLNVKSAGLRNSDDEQSFMREPLVNQEKVIQSRINNETRAITAVKNLQGQALRDQQVATAAKIQSLDEELSAVRSTATQAHAVESSTIRKTLSERTKVINESIRELSRYQTELKRAAAEEDSEADRLHKQHRKRQLSIAQQHRDAIDVRMREEKQAASQLESQYTRAVATARQANDKFVNSAHSAAQAVGTVVRGLGTMGVLGAENSEKLLRGFLGVQAGVDVIFGGIKVIHKLSQAFESQQRAVDAAQRATQLGAAAETARIARLESEAKAALAAAAANRAYAASVSTGGSYFGQSVVPVGGNRQTPTGPHAPSMPQPVITPILPNGSGGQIVRPGATTNTTATPGGNGVPFSAGIGGMAAAVAAAQVAGRLGNATGSATGNGTVGDLAGTGLNVGAAALIQKWMNSAAKQAGANQLAQAGIPTAVPLATRLSAIPMQGLSSLGGGISSLLPGMPVGVGGLAAVGGTGLAAAGGVLAALASGISTGRQSWQNKQTMGVNFWSRSGGTPGSWADRVGGGLVSLEQSPILQQILRAGVPDLGTSWIRRQVTGLGGDELGNLSSQRTSLNRTGADAFNAQGESLQAAERAKPLYVQSAEINARRQARAYEKYQEEKELREEQEQNRESRGALYADRWRQQNDRRDKTMAQAQELRLATTPRESQARRVSRAFGEQIEGLQGRLSMMPDQDSALATSVKNQITMLRRQQRSTSMDDASPQLLAQRGMNNMESQDRQRELSGLRVMQQGMKDDPTVSHKERQEVAERILQVEERMVALNKSRMDIERDIAEERRQSAQEAIEGIKQEIEMRRAEQKTAADKLKSAEQRFGEMTAPEQRRMLQIKAQSASAFDSSLTDEERRFRSGFQQRAQAGMNVSDAEQARYATIQAKGNTAAGKVLSTREAKILADLGLTEDQNILAAHNTARARSAGFNSSSFGIGDRVKKSLAKTVEQKLMVELKDTRDVNVTLTYDNEKVANSIAKKIIPLQRDANEDLIRRIVDNERRELDKMNRDADDKARQRAFRPR